MNRAPFEIIREIIRLGWEVKSADLILYKLDQIEATSADMFDALNEIYLGSAGNEATAIALEALAKAQRA